MPIHRDADIRRRDAEMHMQYVPHCRYPNMWGVNQDLAVIARREASKQRSRKFWSMFMAPAVAADRVAGERVFVPGFRNLVYQPNPGNRRWGGFGGSGSPGAQRTVLS